MRVWRESKEINNDIEGDATFNCLANRASNETSFLIVEEEDDETTKPARSTNAGVQGDETIEPAGPTNAGVQGDETSDPAGPTNPGVQDEEKNESACTDIRTLMSLEHLGNKPGSVQILSRFAGYMFKTNKYSWQTTCNYLSQIRKAIEDGFSS